MGQQQVRRLPVARTEACSAKKAVKGVSRPGARHNQSPGARA